MYYKKMVGKKCYLSPCSLEDAEKWTIWDNDIEVALPLGDEAYTLYSREKSREIVSDVIKQQSKIFSIIDLATDKLIGRCLLFNIDQVNRHAMLGIVIGEKEYWGKGYGQEATSLLLDFGFNLLNLNNIMLGAFEFNTRALACYRKIGFKEIGRRRQVRIIGDRKIDVIMMDILASEFDSPFVLKHIDQETV